MRNTEKKKKVIADKCVGGDRKSPAMKYPQARRVTTEHRKANGKAVTGTRIQ